MAKLVKTEVQVDVHEYEGVEYIGITKLSKYDNGASYPKRFNLPKTMAGALLKQLNAQMGGLAGQVSPLLVVLLSSCRRRLLFYFLI